jgi:hypothetical protein
MIPNIQTGKSFEGAQLYYLHDKREAGEALRLSDERVAWTETRNTAHDAAHEAFAEMVATARDQDQLKMISGIRLSGRPCEEPVMTISLSWHPSENPGKEEMVQAADSYLRHMGWDEHQAVYLGHNDTAHPHLHIVLNRIHPETGKVLDDAFSKNRTQEWARDYEHEHGRIWCEERTGKDYSRPDDREPRSLPHDFAIDAREAQRPYAELEEAARTLDQREREQLANHHKDEREAFFDTRHQQFRDVREVAYREVRDEYKERWVEHFRSSDQLREQAEREAAALALQALACARQGDFAGAWEAISERDAVKKLATQEIADERRELRAEQRTETRERQDEACAALYQERAQAFIDIKQRQKEERAELKELQTDRAQGHPYDKERLIELVTEPAAERLADPSRQTDSARAGDAADSRIPEPSQETLQAEASAELDRAPELIEQRLADREADTGGGRAESDPVADTGEKVAGGIGKVAELLANAMASIIAPPSPREQAMEKALDRVRDEAEAERQPAREEEDAKRRYAAHENQRTATDVFESFFNENAERLKREEQERRQKKNEYDRER